MNRLILWVRGVALLLPLGGLFIGLGARHTLRYSTLAEPSYPQAGRLFR
jgi:hypothetical protein